MVSSIVRVVIPVSCLTFLIYTNPIAPRPVNIGHLYIIYIYNTRAYREYIVTFFLLQLINTACIALITFLVSLQCPTDSSKVSQALTVIFNIS